jgi:hypothetical protein
LASSDEKLQFINEKTTVNQRNYKKHLFIFTKLIPAGGFATTIVMI